VSYKAIQRYINPRDGRVKINMLSKDADILPVRHRNWKSFKSSFGDVNHYNYKFMEYKIVIDLSYAFRHFTHNTYFDFRKNVNATLLPTLLDPVLVVKEKYEGQEVLNFYKPFKNEEELFHMMMFQAYKENNIYKFKTIYGASELGKVKKVIQATDASTVYFKYTEGSGS
jgi:hypothetical protein